MPIVDGLTSTKMIRAFEKTRTDIYSPRAALNGRVPVIAVSASLIEKHRQEYIDAGFDAWILKPISFARLNELMAASVDSKVRKSCLYRPGKWEKGGWFHAGNMASRVALTMSPVEPPVTDLAKGADEEAKAREESTTVEGLDRTPDKHEQPPQAQAKERRRVHYEEEMPVEQSEES